MARSSLYFVPLIAGPLLILVAAFLVVPTQWFVRRAQDPWMIGVGYGANLHHEDCQVVVYGDSTAAVGVIPEIIRQRTGLKACNLGQGQGVIVLSGDFALDAYMRQNTPPRFLVYMYSDEDMNPRSAHINHPIFEGMTYQMGRDHKLATLMSLWRTPEDAFRWFYKGLHMALVNARTRPASMEAVNARERNLGWMPLEDLRMGDNCSDQSKNPAPDPAWIQSQRSKYAGPQTTVLFDLMPLPDCDPSYTTLQREFAGLIDNQVQQLPSRFYFRGGLHVDKAGATELSDRVAAQILARMPQAPVAEAR